MPRLGETKASRNREDWGPPLLIGVYGRIPAHGKSNLAIVLMDCLMSIRGRRSVLRPFTEPLAIAAATYLECALGLSPEEATHHIFDQIDERIAGHSATGRDILNRLRTDAMDQFGTDVWIRRNMARADSDMARGHNVIVDDVQSLQEAAAIVHRGGFIIRVVGALGSDADLLGITFAHAFQTTGSASSPRQQIWGWARSRRL